MKRISKVCKYLLYETTRPVIVFYIVIAAVIALGFSLQVMLNGSTFQLDGMKLATVIFLFVVGLNSFKPSYLFLQANGVTRRHFYLGGLLSVTAVAAALTVTDAVYYSLFNLFIPVNQALSPTLYPGSGYVDGFVWTLALNLLAVAAGWFLSMLYYRMGKGLKIAVSLSPAIIIIGLPFANNATGGRLMGALIRFFSAMMGLAGTPNAYIGAASMLALAAVAFGLCFLLVRRAPIKEQDR